MSNHAKPLRAQRVRSLKRAVKLSGIMKPAHYVPLSLFIPKKWIPTLDIGDTSSVYVQYEKFKLAFSGVVREKYPDTHHIRYLKGAFTKFEKDMKEGGWTGFNILVDMAP